MHYRSAFGQCDPPSSGAAASLDRAGWLLLQNRASLPPPSSWLRADRSTPVEPRGQPGIGIVLQGLGGLADHLHQVPVRASCFSLRESSRKLRIELLAFLPAAVGTTVLLVVVLLDRPARSVSEMALAIESVMLSA